jgi:hypothetical protein
MSTDHLYTDKVFSWQTGVEYLNSRPDIQSYTVCSYGRIGYLLVRTKITGIYLQNTYDGSKLVSSVIMDVDDDYA